MTRAQVLTFCHKSSGTHFAHKADKGAAHTKRELAIGGKKKPTRSYDNNTQKNKSSGNMHFKSLKRQTGRGN